MYVYMYAYMYISGYVYIEATCICICIYRSIVCMHTYTYQRLHIYRYIILYIYIYILGHALAWLWPGHVSPGPVLVKACSDWFRPRQASPVTSIFRLTSGPRSAQLIKSQCAFCFRSSIADNTHVARVCTLPETRTNSWGARTGRAERRPTD